MEKSRVERINELAHKAKTEGLTEEEIIERDRLRQEYLAAFRQNLRAQLDNTYLVDDHGNKRPFIEVELPPSKAIALSNP